MLLGCHVYAFLSILLQRQSQDAVLDISNEARCQYLLTRLQAADFLINDIHDGKAQWLTLMAQASRLAYAARLF